MVLGSPPTIDTLKPDRVQVTGQKGLDVADASIQDTKTVEMCAQLFQASQEKIKKKMHSFASTLRSPKFDFGF